MSHNYFAASEDVPITGTRLPVPPLKYDPVAAIISRSGEELAFSIDNF